MRIGLRAQRCTSPCLRRGRPTRNSRPCSNAPSGHVFCTGPRCLPRRHHRSQRWTEPLMGRGRAPTRPQHLGQRRPSGVSEHDRSLRGRRHEDHHALFGVPTKDPTSSFTWTPWRFGTPWLSDSMMPAPRSSTVRKPSTGTSSAVQSRVPSPVERQAAQAQSVPRVRPFEGSPSPTCGGSRAEHLWPAT